MAGAPALALLCVLLVSVATRGEAQLPSVQRPSSQETSLALLVDLADPAVIDAGRQLFHGTCTHYCHGREARGGGILGPSLHHRDFDNAYLFSRISNGRAPMPAFKDLYSPEQIWKLIAYIQSLKAARD